MDDVVNGVLTTSVVLGGVVGLARTVITNQRRVQILREAGICERCNGTSIQQCQLCYGVGSIARPGYINVADPALRRKCRRCSGFGRLPCARCSAAAHLTPRPTAHAPAAAAMQVRAALPPAGAAPAGGASKQPRRLRRDLASAEQYLQLDVDAGGAGDNLRGLPQPGEAPRGRSPPRV